MEVTTGIIAISFILALILIRFGIRVYFREKRAHLEALLNSQPNDPDKGEE